MSTNPGIKVLLGAFERSARSSLAGDWGESWAGLLSGKRRFKGIETEVQGWPDSKPVACLAEWPTEYQLAGRARALAQALGQDTRPIHKELLHLNPDLKLSIVVATSHGETSAVSEFAEHLQVQKQLLSSSVAEAMLCDVLLGAFLKGLGERCPGSTLSAACASACVATGMAAARIRMGLSDACLVVSLDVLSRTAHAGFSQIGAMSPDGCRPFDRRRNGTTVGEAGAVLLLLSEAVAPPPSLRWLVKVGGFGQSCDARHPVEPSADGLSRALERACVESRNSPRCLAGVYWHGTGTLQNDRTEADVAKRLFGSAAPPGTSTKGAFGHAMGASSALSILAAGESLSSRRLPPVAGLNDTAFPWMNLVMGEPRQLVDGPIAVAALGFGGINAALVLIEEQGEQCRF